MPQKKQTKKAEVRDLKPKKAAQGGLRIAQGGSANALRARERARVSAFRAR